jgi:hypothetical protein
MFISPRLAFRKADDPKGTLRKIVKLGEGKGATNGVAWVDYSGSCVDGDLSRRREDGRRDPDYPRCICL